MARSRNPGFILEEANIVRKRGWRAFIVFVRELLVEGARLSAKKSKTAVSLVYYLRTLIQPNKGESIFMNTEKIGIIGLGKLGLPMLASFIHKGFDVVGYDLNTDLIDNLSRRRPYSEPGLQEVIDNDPLWPSEFHSSIETFVDAGDIFFFIVPTPTAKEVFEISLLSDALQSVAEAVTARSKRSTFIITSTVSIGRFTSFECGVGRAI